MILHTAGFVVGLGLLGWCVSLAFAPANREQLARLSEAPAQLVAIVLTLSLVTLVLNGTAFWLALLPSRRLPLVDVVATNAIATFLNYLPFKLSVLSRVVIHNRKDRVPLAMIAAWLGAVGIVLLGAVGPLVVAGLWLRRVDWTWAGVVAVLAALSFGAIVILSKVFRGEGGLGRLERIAARAGMSVFARPLRSRRWGGIHAGFSMLACPKSVGAAYIVRMVDIGVQATRFGAAAAILGVAMPWEDAILLASTYFIVGVISPTGMLGTREGGVLGLAAVLGLQGKDGIVTVALLVTATEAAVNLAAAGIGGVMLRPDRLLRRAAVSDPPAA